VSTIRARLRDIWQKQLAQHEVREAELARTVPRWRTRRHRRALVLTLAVATLPLIVGALVIGSLSVWTFLWLWGGGFVTYLSAFIALRVLTGKIVIGFSSQLDERERDLRNRATFRGFQINVVLLVLSTICMRFMANGPAGEEGAYSLLSIVIILSCSTPTIILGWTLPDDDPEDIVDVIAEERGKDTRA